MELFAENSIHPAIQALRDLQPDDLSPRQALDTLFRLKALVTE